LAGYGLGTEYLTVCDNAADRAGCDFGCSGTVVLRRQSDEFHLNTLS
jgi:hypothetical protein